MARLAELPDGDGRGFSYVDGRIETLMNDFASQYLVRTNRYTDRAIIDDPGGRVRARDQRERRHAPLRQLMMPGAGRPVHEALLRASARARSPRPWACCSERALQTCLAWPSLLTELEHAWGARQVARCTSSACACRSRRAPACGATRPRTRCRRCRPET
ncbi:MAG: hypothetical protein U0168_13950 [Nannocystaceae bacterium]